MGYSYRRPPISSHRLFPAIVAIWFAALLGLGCLVLPTVLLERLAGASRIDALVPAAASPLGLTARIAFASAAGLFGALLGFAIARRVAIAQAPAPPVSFDRLLRPVDDDPAEGVRRPISASEELGLERFDAPVDEPPAAASPLVRKRPPALPEEPEPEPFPQLDPLSGHAPPWADEHPLMPSAATLAERAIALHGHGQSEFANAPEPEAPALDEPPALAAEAAAETPAAPVPTSSDPAPAEPPLAFAAPSQAQRPIRRKAALAEPLRALLAGEIAPSDKVGGPLARLGMAELAERLARSMHTYDSKLPPRAPEAQPRAAALPDLPAEAAPRSVAPALEEFGEDEDADEPVEEFDATGYGSLLAMTGAQRPFDAPPEAEGQFAQARGRPDPAETERALRSALATLQRMSGAA